jgi:hypothetical protein
MGFPPDTPKDVCGFLQRSQKISYQRFIVRNMPSPTLGFQEEKLKYPRTLNILLAGGQHPD